MIEQEMAERLAAAKVRLRLDKVAVRVVGRVKAALADIVPPDQTVVFTLTAPIRLPAKMAAELARLARGGDFSGTVHGNQVRVHRVTGLSSSAPRVIGFVHNPDSDADVILAMTESRLRDRGSCGST
jgi:hypothetical protein